MNWLGFIRLINNIYGKGEIDLGMIERQGLLAVKIGQVHALRIDFLSEEKCSQLSKLYRNVSRIPPESFDNLLEEYGASDLLKKFSFFDREPFASASVGQVHKARLSSGENVAVKIIKKKNAESFLADVRTVSNLFKAVLFFYPKLKGVANPVGLLDGIRKTTVAELDLRNEAEGHAVLEKIYLENRDKFDLSRLSFSCIYRDISSENIMVSDLIEAPSVDELLEQGKFSYSDLLELFHIHGFFMFVIGIFHGDIHPGNVLYGGGKFYFLDTGYIGKVGTRIRKNLFFFFESLSMYDYERCAFFLNEMADARIEGRQYSDFERKFLELYSDFRGKTVSEVSLTKQMMQTIKLGVVSGMEFEEGIFDIIKSLMYMDGMVRKADPDAILLEDMRRFIGEFKSLMQ